MEDDIKEKILIVNADDFGLDPEINRGIAQSCSDGIVRSVSLLAVGRAFEDALTRIKSFSGIGVGVHVCLVGEKPVLPAARLPSLVDKNGRFYFDWKRFLFRLWTGKMHLGEVAMEVEAQIRKILDGGIIPTHVDSHQYTHFAPEILEIIIKLSKKYNIKYIRYPQRLGGTRAFARSGIIKRMWLSFFSRSQARRIKGQGMSLPDHSYAVEADGRLDSGILKGCLCRIQDGMNDLVCHPGYFPEADKYRRWHYGWETELKALRDPEVVALIREQKIRLSHYAA